MTTAQAQQAVTFRVGSDHFAADISAVERVLRFVTPTAVPNLPEWVEGVIEYQGRVVPVIDLRRRFGIEGGATSPQGSTRIMVFAVGDEWVGAVVDAVLEVVTFPAAQVSPPPAIFRGLSAEYLRGLVRRDGRLLIFLEVTRLLTATEQLVLEQALEEVGKREGGSGKGEGKDGTDDVGSGKRDARRGRRDG